MSDLPDAHLQLKKRARRRLIGAVAFAGLAAVVLPVVMDKAPEPEAQDVDIHIPGQDQAPFTPRLDADKKRLPLEPVRLAEPARPAEKPGKPVVKPAEKPVKPEKPAEKPAKPAEKPEKPAEKPAKPAEKPDVRTSEAQQAEAQRVAAILSGKTVDQASVPPFMVLVGAFSNPSNVKALQAKIRELGIKVHTESFESPDGKRTRVRAGPFSSRAEAEKALTRMQRIGIIDGKIVTKQ